MPSYGNFPNVRARRLRYHPAIRNLAAETYLSVDHLILPLFIRHGTGIKKPITSMPGHFQLTTDQLDDEIATITELGIKKIILFGIPPTKDSVGSHSYCDDGIIQSAIKKIKILCPDLLVIADVCLCEYTDHGHCGVVTKTQTDFMIDNDATLALLAKQAISYAQAGADIIAPSGMIDGMVQAIRQGLDAEQFTHLPILSYAVKYASALYGPFREAAEGAPQFGDRRSYQMAITNVNEALRECDLDVSEGADMLMVKPAHTYLDVICRVKQAYPALPLGAYHTSGEFAMLKSAAEMGKIHEQNTVLEVLTAIRRAGADFIISYYSKEVAAWLNKQ
jgi:porphobilinogen synthase